MGTHHFLTTFFSHLLYIKTTMHILLIPLLVVGVTIAKPSSRTDEDYPFDGSGLIQVVEACTANTAQGEILAEAYNNCNEGDVHCFLETIGWMNNGELSHETIVESLENLPESVTTCALNAAVDNIGLLAEVLDSFFDISEIVDMVSDCTAGTDVGVIIAASYNDCEEGDVDCFLEKIGWMSNGELDHEAIVEGIASLPESVVSCAYDTIQENLVHMG